MRWLIQIRDLDANNDQLRAVHAGILGVLLEQGVGGKLLTVEQWMDEAMRDLHRQPKVAQGNNGAASITEPRWRLQ